MANLGTTLYKFMKSVKKGTHPLADYMKFEREMAGIPLDMPVTGDEVRRARNIINPKKELFVEDVIHTNTGKYDKDVDAFLAEHGYDTQGDFDLIKPIEAEKNINIVNEDVPTYPIDEVKSSKLLHAIKTREKLYEYMRTKNPEIYNELAQILQERPTNNINKRYQQVADWKNRADAKYKEIVNPSGPKRQLSYANTRYTNMDDPIQGNTLNQDYDVFDLEELLKRKEINNDPHLRSYLTSEMQKLNKKDKYDNALVKAISEKLNY